MPGLPTWETISKTHEGWAWAEHAMPPGWVDPVESYQAEQSQKIRKLLKANHLSDTAHIQPLAHIGITRQRKNEIIQYVRMWIMQEAIRLRQSLTAYDSHSGIIGAVPCYDADIPNDWTRDIHARVQEWMEARLRKDWNAADQRREELKGCFVNAAVGRDGTVTWTREDS